MCMCVCVGGWVVIRELCDIGDLGKLTREQFALAIHLINQKLTKGLEPPQTLSPEMIPPSDRLSIKQVRGAGAHQEDHSALTAVLLNWTELSLAWSCSLVQVSWRVLQCFKKVWQPRPWLTTSSTTRVCFLLQCVTKATCLLL